MEETAPILRKLFESIESENDSMVLRYSEQFLILSSDPDILRCKVISLIKLEKFEQAMQIQKSLTIESEDQAFLKGYLSYKLGKFKETVDIIDKYNNDYKNKVLLAQTYNKLENFEKSVKIYVNLL